MIEGSGVNGRASWTVGMGSFPPWAVGCGRLSQAGGWPPLVFHDPSILQVRNLSVDTTDQGIAFCSTAQPPRQAWHLQVVAAHSRWWIVVRVRFGRVLYRQEVYFIGE